MKFNQIFSITNSKLKADNIASFNLQAGKTCPRAKACLKFCYAQKGAYRWPTVKSKRERTFEFTKQDSFVVDMIKTLKEYKGKYKTIRIHDSGDFYNVEYFQKWCEIAFQSPKYNFYAYTKSHAFMDLSFLPTNLKIIQSEGGKDDSKIDTNKAHARIFNSLIELQNADYVDSSTSDLPSSKSENIKIGLVMH